MNIQSIKAVATKPALSIEAALASPEVRSISSRLAAAGIARPTRPIPLAELSEKLKAAGWTVEQRLEAKIIFGRHGLIAD